MAIKSLIKFFANTPVLLMLRIGKSTKEICRTGFVLTAISEGIYDIIQSGNATFEEIQKHLKSDFNPEGYLCSYPISLGGILRELQLLLTVYALY